MRSPLRSSRSPRRARLAAAALLTPFALGLVACGTDATDDPSTVEGGTPDAVVSATESTPSPTVPSGSTGASSAAPTPSSLQAAADTALSQADGRLFAIAQDDGGTWKVTVVESNGTQDEVYVSADGSTSDRMDRDKGADVAQDLLDASVDYGAAITIAQDAVPDGSVIAMELADSDGIPTWTVELESPSGSDGRTLEIDATSAAVKKITAS